MITSRLGRWPVLLLPILLLGLPAVAHEVRHEVSRGEAVLVSMTYADGTPLVGAQYEIWAEGDEGPCITGTTDNEGQVVFLPQRRCNWRIRVFTTDGHGADFTIEAGTDAPVDQTWSPEVAESERKRLVERFAGPMLGLGIIFLVFGLLALFVRRRR
jgi:nickel transport protein